MLSEITGPARTGQQENYVFANLSDDHLSRNWL
jgi:hypothetical protein